MNRWGGTRTGRAAGEIRHVAALVLFELASPTHPWVSRNRLLAETWRSVRRRHLQCADVDVSSVVGDLVRRLERKGVVTRATRDGAAFVRVLDFAGPRR